VRLVASARGEWPPGIHWTAGESRDVPTDYPGADGDRPAWLKVAKKAKKKTKTTKE
jgi:hypothetical protein|tara:strand:+ start:936 stop:1103 length:168 start_codon:yes stop_codon:yes gene_type:complete